MNSVSISAIVESLVNPDGRFRTLKGVFAPAGEGGEPQCRAGSFGCEAEVNYDGHTWTLTAIYDPKCERAEKLREAAAFAHLVDTPRLTPLLYLDGEMLVFDSLGRPVTMDVALARTPEQEKLETWLARAVASSQTEKILEAAGNFGSLAAWMTRHGFCHGELNAGKIHVDTDGAPLLASGTRSCRGRSREEIRELGAIAACLYITACEPGFHRALVPLLEGRGRNFTSLVPILDGIVWSGDTPELKLLLEALAEGADAADAGKIPALISSLTDRGIRPMQFIKDMLRSVGGGGVEDGAENTPKKYEFVAPASDMLMRAFDGSTWMYLDKNGKRAFGGSFISAEDFYEGRAVVETEEGFGMINTEGDFVIPPIYDDLEWDGFNNIAIATKDGLSGLCDREGGEVTGLVYDQILGGGRELIPVRRGKLFGFIRRDGDVAIEPIYDDAFCFRDGHARVRLRGRDYLIDAQGNTIDEIAAVWKEEERSL